MIKKREVIVEVAVFERLKESLDFQIYLNLLQTRKETIVHSLNGLLTTPEQIADHNANVGAIMALNRAIGLIDEQLKKAEQLANRDLKE